MPQDRGRRQRQAKSDKAFCINKNCKNYRVEVELLHGNLTCPECGKTMQPIKADGGSKKGLIAGIAAAVVVAGGASWFALGGNDAVPVSVALSNTELADTVGKTVPLTAVFEPIDSAKAITWESADQEIAVYDEQQQAVKLLKAGETEVKAVINDSTSLICKVKAIEPAKAQEPEEEVTEPKADQVAKTGTGTASGSESVGKYVFGGRATCVKTGTTYEITFVKPYEMDLHDGTTQIFGIGDKIEGAVIRHGKLIQGEYVFKYGGRKLLSGLNNDL